MFVAGPFLTTPMCRNGSQESVTTTIGRVARGSFVLVWTVAQDTGKGLYTLYNFVNFNLNPIL